MRYSLKQIISMLNTAERQGSETDEPEGSRYVLISDTLASDMAASLEAHLAEHENLAGAAETGARPSTLSTEERARLIDRHRRDAGL